MSNITTTTITPTGWLITTHYNKDTKNKVLRTLRDEDGKQIKDFAKLEDFDKDIQAGLSDGTWKFE
jgi:hypothetical protein|tara:strand:- start:2373 stop:2570 length:198 start_codon:yes stop_codon:yes gene_type:complete